MEEIETTRLKLGDVNKNLLCGLCDGYLIDATTIIECLHSFCRTCIVTYLKTSKSCPKCETLVHKTRPHQNLRSDKLLQDLVYKIVPGLYKDEMRRRREFYTVHYEAAPKRPSEERGDEMSDQFVFTQEELISLALHFCPHSTNERSFHRIFKTKEEFKSRPDRKAKDSIEVRYFQCKAAVCVKHLKKLLCLKYDLPTNYQIDMFYNDDLLRDNYSLADVALCYNWRRKSPLRLFFSIFEMTMQKVAHGEEVPKLTHSSNLRWQAPPENGVDSTATTRDTPDEPMEEEKIELKDPAEAKPLDILPSTSTDAPCAVPAKPTDTFFISPKCEITSPLKKKLTKPKVKTKTKQTSDSFPFKFNSPEKSVQKSSNKKNLLGKRPATTPILIAPAPAKKSTLQNGQPLLRMAKMIKLAPPAGIASTSATPPSNQNTVSFIPVSISSVLPPQARQCHPAFMNGYFQSITNTPAVGASRIRIAPALGASASVAAPNHPQTIISPMSPITNLTPAGPAQCISKTLSTLSLTSPPASRCNSTIPSIPVSVTLIQPCSTSSLSLSSSSTSTVFTSSSCPTTCTITASSSSSSSTHSVPAATSSASPTPAASASPTPAAVPSQQSQTQGTDCHHLVALSSSSSGPHSIVKSTTNTNNSCHAYLNLNTAATNVQIKSGQKPHSANDSFQVSNPGVPLFSPVTFDASKNVPDCKTPMQSTALPVQSPTPVDSVRNGSDLKTPTKDSTLPLQSSKTTPSSTSSPSPSSTSISPSSATPSSQSRRPSKQKTIADIANTLHQRMSAHLQNQTSAERNSSISSHKARQQQLQRQQLQQQQLQQQLLHQQQQQLHQQQQQLLQQQHHHQFNPSLLLNTQMSSNGFSIKKEIGAGVLPSPNLPANINMMIPNSLPSMHIAPPPLLDPRSASLMHLHHQQSSLSGHSRMEEPLNLVTRDKDFCMTSNTTPVMRHELPPAVK